MHDLRELLAAVLRTVEEPLIGYFLLINSSYLLLVLLAAVSLVGHMRRTRHRGAAESLRGRLAPGVSVIMPAYNEAAGIVAAVQAMLALRYPRHEVVVVDDGSTDDTFGRLAAAFDLVELDRVLPAEVPVTAPVHAVAVPRDGRTRLVVVRKENSGKTEAVNAGINASAEPLVAVVDADSLLDPDALLTVAKPFTDDPTRVVATGGVIRPANGCTVVAGRVVRIGMPARWLARIQVAEYLRAFLLGRAGWSRLGAVVLISGAFGLFRRDVLVEVGGMRAGTLGEDFDLVVRMHKHLRDQRRDYRIVFVAEPIAWTEVPSTAAVLRRQRRRWHRGLWETLWTYRGMVGRRRYGRVGTVALPWYWLFELLAPVLELGGLVLVTAGLAVGAVGPGYVGLFLAVAYGYAIVLSLAVLVIEELSFHKYPRWQDLAVLLAAAVLENVGYRQITAWWRLEGAWQAVTRRTPVWGAMARQGFTNSGVDHG
ncbi:glycosyltransferase family 2 protein [Actinophytocola xanthii]|uniref:Glycosyltransferase n=1 Tax=Actinophytocola xanthii TaxID=1912961 RepID=A0A1Q8BYW5_9PSEU|nr:glycosyltransferase family 2 protein [Actinophytocola xanthii]OLF07299.1 glycosyltransferase [Actinophytocola xanthii]OLF07455.1 glycosyltransferase [Actinophytocola xanthii]